MTEQPTESQQPRTSTAATPPALEAPFIRAPEGARTILLVTLGAACGPLAAGALLFGWRALVVAAISIVSCAVIERLYYRVTRTPALLGRTHAYLTGMLLALTLPPFVPWYVPVVAAAFAIVVGKCIFGGVGHFLWPPALVGRLAVAVIFPAVVNPATWPVLSQSRLLIGDVTRTRRPEQYSQWRGTGPPAGADAFSLTPPQAVLRGLTNAKVPPFSALAYAPEDITPAKPTALTKLVPINDLVYGARPGGIGETCAVIIIVAGLYLVYRNYVKGHLPLMFVASAWLVAAAAPIQLAGANNTTITVWWPLLAEGLDVGFTYVNYQILSGELLLAAFFLATEMTSRPVTTGGQVIYAAGCGSLAMLGKLYLAVPIPCYMAVLAMSTLTPIIDAMWRPRVLGRRRFAWLFKK